MAIYEDPPPAVPEWVITYGDMMSLILTFFIMIVGMSELKKNDKFQGVADAMEQQFGAAKTTPTGNLRDSQPRGGLVAEKIAAGRTRRELELQGGAPLALVAKRRPANVEMEMVVTLHEPSLTITKDSLSLLTSEAEAWLQTKQTIEVRGYAASLPLTNPARENSQFRDAWDLAYERARVVARYLKEDLHIDAGRIRVTSVGTVDSPRFGRNSSRVVVILHPAEESARMETAQHSTTSLQWK